MLPAALALALLISTPAQAQGAQDAQAVRREASAVETDSFNAWYRTQTPQPAAPAALFSVTRQPGRREWKLEASVDGAPYRGTGTLCRMTRSVFSYDARAPNDKRWSPAAPKRFAWLDRGPCRKPAVPVELLQRVPDADLVPLVAHHAVLLQRSRLLFSGNTSCAPHRSLRYWLAAIDVSAPPHGREELPALVFANDVQMRATVWIKKRGRELNAWDVACLPGTPPAR